MAIETKFSKLSIICNLDEHLYAQLSKWALWLLFVMSKFELSLILNTHIIFFLREGLKDLERKALITISPLLPANHNMTPVCFGIAKVQCQKLNLNGYFFSISYMPMYVLLKKKNMQRKIKSKKIKNAFKYDCKHVF